MNKLYDNLKKYGRLKLNESLAKHTTFKIGGPARYFVTVEKTDQLVGLLNFLSQNGHEYFVLGGGSNMLMPDDGFDGVAVKIKTDGLCLKGQTIEAESGVMLAQIVNFCAQNSLTGLEWAAGIPGTIGGGVAGNAGAMGLDFSKSVSRVQIWREGEVMEIENQECGFVYRSSAIKQNKWTVLRAWFDLKKGDKKDIMALMQKYFFQRSCRITSNPTSGCTFRNVSLSEYKGDQSELDPIFVERGKVPAGWLIEKAGAAGLAKGGARLSAQHSNIIENFDQAKAEDVQKLIEMIKEKVYTKFSVNLQEEMQIL
ncbi:MAG: UDP-N-acetylenolpyruvoylglucosamine reductase [Candidatus Magasanikbacteria bacterium CG10_big_fil_rev_8_21_14_0_10_40_10]|uniref:UDP-N-acetylenolpyruvoylglucosamine reductase n=1 Tax=Candidatus Magasanikbacteria bacterium CG10_big_fil_rev_8_21_14_0_10_40_10 TaxID=1974648 RepID=A0A2M6W4S1_9BACT|nr:MAG: UDP-N-acetylenolpyruvoylglucosamine reductase [Candidatus Magasanikbacteria bacterium CG10_big_fil_rev_8_21_14_0_10_40_10]